MRPLKEMPLTLVRSIRFILCDIDDTLTVEGTLPAETFTMLHRLKESGFSVIPVTGRPAGWCDHIARFWPVDGIVGENGAFYFRYDPDSKKMIRHYFKDEASRHKDRERLNTIQEQILTDIPGSAISADQAYREADLASISVRMSLHSPRRGSKKSWKSLNLMEHWPKSVRSM